MIILYVWQNMGSMVANDVGTGANWVRWQTRWRPDGENSRGTRWWRQALAHGGRCGLQAAVEQGIEWLGSVDAHGSQEGGDDSQRQLRGLKGGSGHRWCLAMVAKVTGYCIYHFSEKKKQKIDGEEGKRWSETKKKGKIKDT